MVEHRTITVTGIRAVLLDDDSAGKLTAALGVWVNDPDAIFDLDHSQPLLLDLDAAPQAGQDGFTLRMRNSDVSVQLRLPAAPLLLAAAGQEIDPGGHPSVSLAVVTGDYPAADTAADLHLQPGQARILLLPAAAVLEAAETTLNPEHAHLLMHQSTAMNVDHTQDMVAERVIADLVADAARAEGHGHPPQLLEQVVLGLGRGTFPITLTALLDEADDVLTRHADAVIIGVDGDEDELNDVAHDVQDEIPGAGLLLKLAAADTLDPDEDNSDFIAALGVEDPEMPAEETALWRWLDITGRDDDTPARIASLTTAILLCGWIGNRYEVEQPTNLADAVVGELSAATAVVAAACVAAGDSRSAQHLAENGPWQDLPDTLAINSADDLLRHVVADSAQAQTWTVGDLITHAARLTPEAAAELARTWGDQHSRPLMELLEEQDALRELGGTPSMFTAEDTSQTVMAPLTAAAVIVTADAPAGTRDDLADPRTLWPALPNASWWPRLTGDLGTQVSVWPLVAVVGDSNDALAERLFVKFCADDHPDPLRRHLLHVTWQRALAAAAGIGTQLPVTDLLTGSGIPDSDARRFAAAIGRDEPVPADVLAAAVVRAVRWLTPACWDSFREGLRDCLGVRADDD